MKKIAISQILKDNPYLQLLNDVDIKTRFLDTVEISRPGVEMFGFLNHYDPKRIQLYGLQETAALETEVTKKEMENLLVPEVPLVIFSRGITPPDEFLSIATEQGIPVVGTNEVTSKVFSKVYDYVEDQLAPEVKVHGVMMNIYGMGVLLKGKSGIGKSEVALELVKKGHYLVCDDSVIIRRVDSETLMTSAPELLQSKMEIRGIGIVDIQKLYGVTSVQMEAELDLVIELTDSTENIERVGVKEIYEDILEVSKRKMLIPVLKGKAIANLVEVAVADYQLKRDYGYSASEEFVNNLNNAIKNKGE